MRYELKRLRELSAVYKYIARCFEDSFAEYLQREYLFVTLPRNTMLKVLAIPRDVSIILAKLDDVHIASAGLLIGWLKGSNFVPSTELFNLARRQGFRYGCAVIAREQGVKAFLYGNDLLVASVDRFVEPISKGWYVAVVDPSDMIVIGIGRLLIDAEELERLVREGRMLEVAVKNVFDVGKAIREEEFFA